MENTTAAAQAARLRDIAAHWASDIEAAADAGLHQAVARFETRRDAAAETGARFEAGKELLRALAEEMDASWSVDPSSNRLAAARKGVAAVDGEEERFLVDEERLIAALRDAGKATGTPSFDAVLSAFESFDRQKAERYGMDYGLRRTVAMVIPLAEVSLALMAGRAEVPDVLDRYAAPDDADSRPGI